MNNKLNKKILEFLIKKNNKKIEFYQKISKEIQNIKDNNKINFQYINCLGKNYSFSKENKNNKEINNNKKYNNNNNLRITTESFSLNENLKLLDEFKNEDKIKIEKPKANNPNEISFCEDLSMNFDYPKNIKQPQQQIPSSFYNLNRTLLLISPKFNNNDNTTILKNNMNNSFM